MLSFYNAQGLEFKVSECEPTSEPWIYSQR